MVTQLTRPFFQILTFPLTRLHPITISAVVLFSYVVLSPQKIEPTQYLPVQNPLQIFIPESSPGYSAFQDLSLSSGQERTKVASQEEVAHFVPVFLRSGDVTLVLIKQKPLDSPTKKEIQQLKLKPIIISQPTSAPASTNIVTNVDLKPLAVPTQKLASVKPQLIQGEVQLTGGLAFTGSDSLIRVYQRDQESNQESEVTAVWPEKGKFEILVPEQKGQLVAELRDVHGKLLGADEIDLSNPQSGTGYHFKLSPRAQGIEVETFEGHNYIGAPKRIVNSRVLNPALSLEFEQDSEHRFTETRFSKNSQVLVGGYSEGYFPSLSIVRHGQTKPLDLYSEKVIYGLAQIVRPGPQLEGKAIIWGRVIKDGKPVAGAKVYLNSARDTLPIYFSSYLPDQNLVTTGPEGDFVFMDLNPGLHSVSVFHPQHKFPTEYVATESGMVSPIQLESTSLKKVTARIYSAVESALSQDQPREGLIRVNESKHQLRLSTHQWNSMQVFRGYGLMDIQSVPTEETEATHFYWSRDQGQLNVPIIPTNWFVDLINRAKLTAETKQGLIMGFGFKGPYEVYVTDDSAQVIYFDQYGQIINESETNKIRFGFLIVNASDNYHQVSIVQKQSGKVATRIVKPKADSVALVF